MHLCGQISPFDEPLEAVLEFFEAVEIETVDLKANLDEYLDDDASQKALLELLDSYGVGIAILGAGGINPLHPVEEQARQADEQLRGAIRLADQLGVDTVTTFSGLPGGSPEDVTPNWFTSPVPPRGQIESHEYQWNDVAIPYWQDLADFADDHGIDIAIELHVRTLVNGPAELLRLRKAANDRIGGYVDPGHLWIQGIDPTVAIRRLAEENANHFFEASDVKLYHQNLMLRGVNDMTPMHDGLDRSWLFCTVGYGHGGKAWRDIIATLHLVGYDGPVSIQQRHTPEPQYEGFERAASFLRDMLL